MMKDEAWYRLVLNAYRGVFQKVVLEHTAESVAFATALGAAEKYGAGFVGVHENGLCVAIAVSVAQIESQESILRKGRDGWEAKVVCVVFYPELIGTLVAVGGLERDVLESGERRSFGIVF
jgi:hypothetical protein